MSRNCATLAETFCDNCKSVPFRSHRRSCITIKKCYEPQFEYKVGVKDYKLGPSNKLFHLYQTLTVWYKCFRPTSLLFRWLCGKVKIILLLLVTFASQTLQTFVLNQNTQRTLRYHHNA